MKITYHCGGTTSTGSGHYGDDLERYGKIDSFPTNLIGTWVIDGISYQAGNGTQFEQEDGTFAVGQCVEVKYLNDNNVAIEIETESNYHCGGSSTMNNTVGSYAKAYGLLTSFPTNLTGSWVIGGVTYQADATTYFEQTHGNFANGVCIEVEYQTSNNLALEIEVEDAYHCGTSTVVPSSSAPSLSVNHTATANGSSVVFVAEDFPSDASVSVYINGEIVAPFPQTNSDGWATFAITGDATRAPQQTAQVEVVVENQRASAPLVQFNAGQSSSQLPQGYSSTLYDLNNLNTLNHKVFIPITQ